VRSPVAPRIGDLAFGGGPVLALAKVGILVASIVAGVGGYVVLRFATRGSVAPSALPGLALQA
jgi:Na+/H+ antiporter NhaA